MLLKSGGTSGVGEEPTSEEEPTSDPETLVVGRTLDERVEVYRLLVNCERFGAQMAGDMHPEAIDVNHPDYDQDTIGEGLVEHAETQSSFEESCKSNLRDNEVFPSLIGVSEDEFKKLEVAIAEEVVSYVEAVEFMNSPFYYPELSDER